MVKQKQRFGCVYRITNLITNKKYIGKTICGFKRRMGQHRRSKTNTYLSRSIQKNGWDNFKKEIIIDDVPEEDLNNLEISYIKVENTMTPHGYNLTLGGEGKSGHKASKETREKNKQSAIRQHTNRDQVGNMTFTERGKKYQVTGPGPVCKYIGRYLTKEKAIKALNHFNATGKIIDPDRTIRKMGTGCVTFKKSNNKYQVYGPKPDSKYIGSYLTKEKAEEVLNHFNATGNIIESDTTIRKKGTGCIRKSRNGERYQARYVKNRKEFSKTFDTPEQCEEWLKTEMSMSI